MRFGVIFTADTDRESEIETAEEVAGRFDLQKTEGDDCTQYTHVFGDDARHRKFTGLLSQPELESLSGALSLYPASPDERGPVLGAPSGSGGSLWLTALGLYFNSPHTLNELCVVPYPDMVQVKPWGLSEREADRLFRAVYRHFR